MILPFDTASHAAAFNAARPEYPAEMVAEIAEQCESRGIPFCWTCNDWHDTDDLHSY